MRRPRRLPLAYRDMSTGLRTETIIVPTSSTGKRAFSAMDPDWRHYRMLSAQFIGESASLSRTTCRLERASG